MNNLDAITPVEELNVSNGEWDLGPDTLMPAESFYSSRLDVPVILKSKDVDKTKYPIYSIYTVFKQTVTQRPDFPALAQKINNEWFYYSYDSYWKLCHKAAKSFIKVLILFKI